ncbi:hypothetical protein DRQ53_11900 [bacterium]|nr:MAG: hypothetical protein DRQ32_09210 [bacterium]RKZ14261.1 MAG: hypothetical protein DRQ53_11900 [bacterium]
MNACDRARLSFLLSFTLLAGSSLVAQSEELPPEFHGRWELSGAYTAFYEPTYWDVDADHRIQVYMQGAYAWFFDGSLDGVHQVEMDAQPDYPSPGFWLVDVTATCHEGCGLEATGAWPGPTVMSVQMEPSFEGDLTLCPDPPCLLITDLLGGSERLNFYTRLATTPAEVIPFSAVKSRY